MFRIFGKDAGDRQEVLIFMNGKPEGSVVSRENGTFVVSGGLPEGVVGLNTFEAAVRDSSGGFGVVGAKSEPFVISYEPQEPPLFLFINQKTYTSSDPSGKVYLNSTVTVNFNLA